jgi:hypothetical protein
MEPRDPASAPRPNVIAFPEGRRADGIELRRLDQRVAELSTQIGELTIVIDELRELMVENGTHRPAEPQPNRHFGR